MSKQIQARRTYRRRTGLTVSLAVATITASAMAVAGPFCSNGQRYSGPAMSPYSPMGMAPQAAYGSAPMRAPMYAAPQAGAGNMRAPGGYQMPAYGGYPGMYGNRGYGQQAAPAASQVQTAKDTSQADQASNAVTVRINGMQYEPANITIEPGTTVTWIHNSSMPHTVSGKDGLRSKTMYQGQRFSHTFDEAGNFDYICDFHPNMKGSVIVKDGGTRT